MILAGDIGGTNTRLTLFDYSRQGSAAGGGRLSPVRQTRFLSGDYPHLSDIIREFLEIDNAKVLAACLGVPGPVSLGIAQVTNLPWKLSEERLQHALNIPSVRLVNDHALTAYAIPFLTAGQASVIYPGQEDREQTIFSVIAPGTGLGQSMLIKHGARDIVVSSEGGHVEFAPRNERDVSLLKFMWKKLGKRVSMERFLTGPGILNLYEFERTKGGEPEPEWLAQQISERGAKAITETALADKDIACTRTLELFSELLGSHCGNVVLSTVCTAGVYLGGGIVRSIRRFFEREQFITAYTAKGRLSPVVVQTPIYLFEAPDIALDGAAQMALTLLDKT